MHTPPPSALPRNLARMARVLDAPDEQRAKMERLVRLGHHVPELSTLAALQQPDAHRVPGCASNVHLSLNLQRDGTLRPEGSADSRIARGMLALVCRGLRGEPAHVLRHLQHEQLARAAGLSGVLSDSRLNGLASMLAHLRAQLDAPPERSPSIACASSSSSATPPPGVLFAASSGTFSAAPSEVAVLLSGGVDSSVALRRLQEAGERVRAFYLRIWLEDEDQHAARGECPWEDDWACATAVCHQAGVPLEPVSLQSEYSQHVVDYLISEAAAGRTPNPDIMCNSRIKFGAFVDAVGKDFGSIASGHYARTARVERGGSTPPAMGARIRSIGDLDPSWARLAGAPPPPRARGTARRCAAPLAGAARTPSLADGDLETLLLTSSDAHKDQTYFLSQLSQAQLSKARFPIGDLSKPEVRALAERMSLPNRHRKDSQGICFLGKVNYDSFLREHLGEQMGEVLEFETGERVGTHRGLWFHTVGQRRGVGPVLDPKKVAMGPWYVVKKSIESNVLYVSRQYQSHDKARNCFSAEAINWIAQRPPAAGELTVKLRHGAATHQATVEFANGGARALVRLHSRDKGLASGQFCAFYEGDVCLGSGVILTSDESY